MNLKHWFFGYLAAFSWVGASVEPTEKERFRSFGRMFLEGRILQSGVLEAQPTTFRQTFLDGRILQSGVLEAQPTTFRQTFLDGRILLAQAQKAGHKTSLSRNPAENRRFQAGGVVLSFREWPNEGESRKILAYSSKNGLVKTGVLPLPGLSQDLIEELGLVKKWIFSWSDGDKAKSVGQAYRICFRFPQVASLLSCEPDFQNAPAFTRSLNSIEKSEGLARQWWGAVRGFFNSFRKQDKVQENSDFSLNPGETSPDPPPTPPPAPRPDTGNFDSCGIVRPIKISYRQSLYYGGFRHKKRKIKTTAGRLWAQQMIGADLLREELKKKLLKIASQ